MRAENTGHKQGLAKLVAEGDGLESPAETVADEIIDRAVANSEVVRLSAESFKSPAGSPDQNLRLEVELLHRPIAKLTGAFEMAERGIGRLEQFKSVDDGVASLYLDAQRLGDGDVRNEDRKQYRWARSSAPTCILRASSLADRHGPSG